MKSSLIWKSAILLALALGTQAAFAVTPEEESEKKCMKPKFRDFTPAVNAEVAAGTDISFHVNRLADPAHIKATAKGIPMKLEIADKKTFYYAKGKLPADLTTGFARIHIQAKAAEGDCLGQDGWLIKIKGDEAAATEQDASAESAEKPAGATQ